MRYTILFGYRNNQEEIMVPDELLERVLVVLMTLGAEVREILPYE